jgi:hypothetical protein
MPGENSLLPQYYNDDFQVVVFNNAIAAPHDPTMLLYADRDMIIDEIVVGVHAVGGASAVLNFESTVDISNTTPAGSVMASVNIDTANITAGDTFVLTTDGITRTTSAGVVTTTSTGTTAINAVSAGVQSNFIPKGSWLVADITGTIGAGRVAIQIRFRSRLK